MKLEIEVGSYEAEYAGCGSHMIQLTFDLDKENIEALMDRCERALGLKPSFEEERRLNQIERDRQNREKGLI